MTLSARTIRGRSATLNCQVPFIQFHCWLRKLIPPCKCSDPKKTHKVSRWTISARLYMSPVHHLHISSSNSRVLPLKCCAIFQAIQTLSPWQWRNFGDCHESPANSVNQRAASSSQNDSMTACCCCEEARRPGTYEELAYQSSVLKLFTMFKTKVR